MSKGEVRLGSQLMSLTCELSVVVGKSSDTWVLLAVTVTVEVPADNLADVVEYSGGRSCRLASFGDTRPTGTRQHSDNTSSSTHQLAVKQTLGTTGGKVGQAMMILQEID